MSEISGYEINEENGTIKNLNVGELLGRPLAERQVAAEKIEKSVCATFGHGDGRSLFTHLRNL